MISDFIRHCIPGVFTLLYATWLTCQVFSRYYKSLLLRPGTYRSQLCYPWKNRIPFDMYFACVVAFVGAVVEAYYGAINPRNKGLHHVSAYIMYEVLGIAGILRLRKWKLPENLEYVLFAAAFSLQAMIFYYHLNFSEINSMAHKLLCYVDVAIAVTTLLEMANPTSILVALSRCYFLQVSATWYFCLAQILHPIGLWGTNESANVHKKMMMIPVFYAWNLITGVLTVTFIGIMQYIRVRDFKNSMTSASEHLISPGRGPLQKDDIE